VAVCDQFSFYADASLHDTSFLAGGKRVQYGTWVETPITDPELIRAERIFNTPGFGLLTARNIDQKNRDMRLAYFNPDLSLNWSQTVTGCGQIPTGVAASPADSSLILVGISNSSNTFSPTVATKSNRCGFIVKIGNMPVTATRPLKIWASALAIWPNPTLNEVHVSTSVSAELLSLDGRKLAQAKPSGGVARFNLKTLPQGTYIIRCADGRVARIVRE
jgi:hypothetical protein